MNKLILVTLLISAGCVLMMGVHLWSLVLEILLNGRIVLLGNQCQSQTR